MAESVIHWFRRDLRLEDNLALEAAFRSGDPVLPVFILDDAILGHPIGRRRLGLLRAALEDLDEQLRGRGSGLLVRRGDVARELNHLAEEADSWGVYLNRDHTPYARQRDTRATRGLQMTGVVTQTFDDLLLVSPQVLVDADGLAPESFEKFSGQWLERLDVDPGAAQEDAGRLLVVADAPESIAGWAATLGSTEDQPAAPGATSASARSSLQDFLDRLPMYSDADQLEGASSPLWLALRLGTISVRAVARAVLGRAAADESCRRGAEAFILDLCHREHAYHLLQAHPDRLRAPGPEGAYVRHWLRAID